MKKSLKVNKKEQSWKATNLINQKLNKAPWFQSGYSHNLKSFAAQTSLTAGPILGTQPRHNGVPPISRSDYHWVSEWPKGNNGTAK